MRSAWRAFRQQTTEEESGGPLRGEGCHNKVRQEAHVWGVVSSADSVFGGGAVTVTSNDPEQPLLGSPESPARRFGTQKDTETPSNGGLAFNV